MFYVVSEVLNRTGTFDLDSDESLRSEGLYKSDFSGLVLKSNRTLVSLYLLSVYDVTIIRQNVLGALLLIVSMYTYLKRNR